jgi:PST family polysaccharide transporter
MLVVSVYGLNFIPTAFKSVSIALLNRRMAFDRVTMLSLIEAVTASLTSLVLALLGYSFWSLVIGNTVAVSVSAVVAAIWANPGFSLDWRLVHRSGTLHYGYKVLVSRVAWYIYASTDFLIIGRRIGAQALGHYNLAYQLASAPADRVTGALTQVLFPVMSTMQQDAAQLGRYLRNSLEACALVLLPAYVGLAIVAPDLVALVLGPKWQGAAAILVMLSLAAVVRSLTGIANTVLLSAGNARLPAKLSVIGLIVFPPAFYVASYWGPAAVATVWLLLYTPILAVPTFRAALRLTAMRVRDLVDLLGPFAAATIVMAAVSIGVRMALAHGPVAARLALAITAGAVTYIALLAVLCPGRLRRYFTLVTRAFPGRLRPATAAP